MFCIKTLILDLGGDRMPKSGENGESAADRRRRWALKIKKMRQKKQIIPKLIRHKVSWPKREMYTKCESGVKLDKIETSYNVLLNTLRNLNTQRLVI